MFSPRQKSGFPTTGVIIKTVRHISSSSVKTGLKRVLLLTLYPHMYLYLWIQELKIWFDALRPWKNVEIMSVVNIYHIIYGKGQSLAPGLVLLSRDFTIQCNTHV